MGGGYTKRELMDAVMGALRPLAAGSGGYIRLLETDGLDGRAADLVGGALRLPAVFVSYSSSTYSQGQYMHLSETVGLDVTVIVQFGAEPAPEKVLGDIRAALCGSTLGLDIKPVRLLRETPVQAGGHATAYSALYALSQELPDGQ